MALFDALLQRSKALRGLAETVLTRAMRVAAAWISAIDRRGCEAVCRGRHAVQLLVFVTVVILGDVHPAIAQFVVTPPNITCNSDTRLAVPLAGTMWCADSTSNTINGWDGTRWQSATA